MHQMEVRYLSDNRYQSIRPLLTRSGRPSARCLVWGFRYKYSFSAQKIAQVWIKDAAEDSYMLSISVLLLQYIYIIYIYL